MNRLIIRADANTEMGTGHLMRCLALGQAWKDAGGLVSFITCCNSESLLRRLKLERFDVHRLGEACPASGDWEATREVLKLYPDAWVALDGYHFGESYQEAVKGSGHRLLVIDDLARLEHYCADVLVNQNLFADRLRYSCEPYTRLLLGTCHVLLRREFGSWIGWRREIPGVARRILVTLGGSDPLNHTLKVIGGIQAVDVQEAEVTVVVGAGNPHLRTLRTAAKQSRIPIRLVRDVQNMPELMAWADVSVSGTGSTIWELLFLGTPDVALALYEGEGAVADQWEGARLVRKVETQAGRCFEGLAAVLSSFMVDLRSRVECSEHGRQTVDGRGPARVVNSMRI